MRILVVGKSRLERRTMADMVPVFLRDDERIGTVYTVGNAKNSCTDRDAAAVVECGALIDRYSFAAKMACGSDIVVVYSWGLDESLSDTSEEIKAACSNALLYAEERYPFSYVVSIDENIQNGSIIYVGQDPQNLAQLIKGGFDGV